ncbi:MAG: lysylphosphatidylglycerol synthase transmembrane domain-containing protein [Anaerolineae bacterium]
MRKWNLVLGVLISLICLALAVTGVEWRRAGEALQRADWRYFLPAGLGVLAYLAARAVRWRILLGYRVRLLDAFSVVNIGYLVSNVLPFRLGDPARAVAVGLDGKVKISAALSTIVVERVLDMLTVVLLLAVTLPFVGETGWARRAGLLGGLLGLGSLAALVALAARPRWGRQAVAWILGQLPSIDVDRWLGWFDGLLEGLEALRSVRRAVELMAWSVVIWALTVAHYVAVLHAFMDHPGVWEASFLTAATGLGMAVPSSPGAMGVFHSVARYALELPFGVPTETAVVVAFASHTFQYLIMCLLGLVGLVQQNLSFAQLRADAVSTATKE